MTAIVVFALTYVALALGRIPGLRSDRVAAVIVGGALMVAFRVMSFADAQRAVDGGTIALLFGMMVVSAALELSGAFALAGWHVMRLARAPLSLLVAVAVAAAVLSALMINDVVCLAFTPLVLHICDALECEPKPYLIALATSSNIGSVATITGNPQNMLIGSLSHISYGHFALVLAPVSVVALGVNVTIIWLVYRNELPRAFARRDESPEPETRRAGVWKGTLVGVAVLVAFVAGAPPPLAALLGGSAMLLTRAMEPKELYARVDWALLALFCGLFVVVGGMERAGLPEHLLGLVTALRSDTVWGLSALTALLSNVVSNVPAVMVLKSSIPHLPHVESAWLTLAMASTLAGNLTLPGSLATIIVVERARERTTLTFTEFFRVGLPTAVLTVLLGAAWLGLLERLG
jgi:Na+/H+ antiporter NhaD/arsenite permease-like protein